jgi:hypothetical protein
MNFAPVARPGDTALDNEMLTATLLPGSREGFCRCETLVNGCN